MSNNYNYIYVLSPGKTKTGGTELLHQLVFQINQTGKKSIIIYNTDDISKASLMEPFSKYLNTNTYGCLTDIVDDSNNLLIVPEIYIDIALNYKNIQKSIWWLSVDNFLEKQAGISGRIKVKGIMKGILGGIKESINGRLKNQTHQLINIDTHYCQSHYAMEFVKSLGVMENKIYYLSDYINDSYFENIHQFCSRDRENYVLYNPKKGYAFTKKIIERTPDLNWKPLINMTNDELKKLMLKSKVYIDFGHHPGKDRLPREAAISGCCIITGMRGAAKYEEDVKIASKYKFADKNRSINEIILCIKDCIDNYDERIKDFSNYIGSISLEKQDFIECVDKYFG